jgi:purine-binding chemotaxis protein CheW
MNSMEPKADGNMNPAGRTPGKSHGQFHRELLQLVGFHIGDEEYCLDILRVQEIIRLQLLTRVPNAPDAMEGVMNLRGKIIPVIALRKCFGLEQMAPDKQARIVVVEVKGAVFGFIVDSVSEVLRIATDTVEPPPQLGKVQQEYVSGVGKIDDRLLILLDLDRLMSRDDLMGATQAQDLVCRGET